MNKDEKDSSELVTRYALVPAILCPLCFILPYGYSIGTTNSVAETVKEFYNDSHLERYGQPLTVETDDLLWVLTETFFPLGGVFGSLLVRPLMLKFGLRRSMIGAQGLCVLSTLLMSLSNVMRSYEAIIIGRFLLGAYCAMGIGIGPIYVAEISSPTVRGPISGLFGVAIGIGMAIGNALGLKEVLNNIYQDNNIPTQILGTKTGWPYLFALTVIPSIVFLLYVKWIPETPRHVLMKYKDETAARNILTKLRGTDNVDRELDGIKHLAVTKIKILTVVEVLTTKSLRWQLACTVVVLATVQLTGINGIQFNLNTVFLTAGIPHSIVGYISLGVVSVQIVISLVASLVSQKFGRRTLILFGNIVIVVSMAVYTISLALLDHAQWLSYISIVATLGFIIGVNSGPGVVAYVMAPELNNETARPGVMTVAVFSFWLAFTTVTFVTPYMFEYLSFYVMLPFMCIAVSTVLFIYKFVPETQGKSIEEIEEFFRLGEKETNNNNLKKSISTTAFVNSGFGLNESEDLSEL